MQPYGAGAEQRGAGHQRAGVGHVEAVHVLFRGDGFEHLVAVDVLGQRQLHQDAVDLRVVVQFVDAGQQVGFGQVGRVAVQRRIKPLSSQAFTLLRT
jgi:hypothetical protein